MPATTPQQTMQLHSFLNLGAGLMATTVFAFTVVSSTLEVSTPTPTSKELLEKLEPHLQGIILLSEREFDKLSGPVFIAQEVFQTAGWMPFEGRYRPVASDMDFLLRPGDPGVVCRYLMALCEPQSDCIVCTKRAEHGYTYYVSDQQYIPTDHTPVQMGSMSCVLGSIMSINDENPN
ncbi:hypothetical protein EJ02DRAFT_7366 [Clathrospora elynae]|uniref:Uncharacterized protein n=1 Tax=Clathrospora elynae TaxID=706981 RepID=A0A6A5T5K9_9PLEO|nr:hypothetical protein EJ02DRAFT_7366 [Clathrospora elynae]